MRLQGKTQIEVNAEFENKPIDRHVILWARISLAKCNGHVKGSRIELCCMKMNGAFSGILKWYHSCASIHSAERIKWWGIKEALQLLKQDN